MPDVQILISAVSNEFGSYRPQLRHYLDLHHVTAKIQQDFPTDDLATLEQLATYVGSCEAVVHLVGRQPGYPVNAKSLAWLKQRYPSLADDQPELREVLDGTYAASYTQWEAYLARLLGKKLLIFKAAPDARPDKEALPPEKPVQSQEQHLQRLRRLELYAAATPFESAHHLAAEVMHSGLVPLLVEAGVVARLGILRPSPTNMPFSLKSGFKGRAEQLLELRANFDAGRHWQALHGLGGVGKTQLAVEYAWQYQQRYEALLFVRADTLANLEANLAALGGPEVLQIDGYSPDGQDLAQRVAAVLNWLRGHSRWLLVLDSVDADEAAQAVVDRWLTHLHTGHLLITTRLNAWGEPVYSSEVKVLSTAVAQDLLLTQTYGKRRHTSNDKAEAEGLAQDLGGLALALKHAISYLLAERISLKAYRQQWAANDQTIRTWASEGLMAQAQSVATTWQTSFRRLDAEAQALLRHLAWLSAEPIPRALVKVPLPYTQRSLLQKSLRTLIRYSLVSETDDAAFTVHRLVQEVTRAELADEERRQVFAETLAWLLAAGQVDWLGAEEEPLPNFSPHTTELLTRHLSEVGDYELVWVQFREMPDQAELLLSEAMRQAWLESRPIELHHPGALCYQQLLRQRGQSEQAIAAALSELGITIPGGKNGNTSAG